MASMNGISRVIVAGVITAAICASAPEARAGNNGLAVSPPMGWSSWSSQLMFIDEASIREIAEVQAAILKDAGYVYVLVDGGWYVNPDVAIDEYGRWVVDASKFPSGMRALADHVHRLGLKFGIYVTPGIPKKAVTDDTPIEGTPYSAAGIANTRKQEITYLGGTMYYINYKKPGAQEFVNSWANQFASWGVDYVKLDGVGTWDVPDIAAWSKALAQTGRPIHLALANNLDPQKLSTWAKYANSWRTSTDIEAYNGTTLTSWERVKVRFDVQPNWLRGGASGGWNDLDSLIAGGPYTGLSADERRTVVSFWALSASPLIIGDDLRTLDPLGFALLTNREVISVNQSGVVAAPLNIGSGRQVWAALQPDGSYAVGLFNLTDAPAVVDVAWSSLGFTGPAVVRDLWSHSDVGVFDTGFGGPIDPHASVLLRVTPAAPVQQWLAPAAKLAQGASLRASTVSPGGQRVQHVGFASSMTFRKVRVAQGGLYRLTINYVNGNAAPGAAIMSVNGTAVPLEFPQAGNWESESTNQGVTTQVALKPGNNVIAFSNPTAMAPEFVGITLQSELPATPASYTLRSVFSAKTLNGAFASGGAGAIVQSADVGSLSEQWQMLQNDDGTYRFVNRASGEALEVSGGSKVPGATLTQSPYAGGAHQHWRPVAAGGGAFVLVNVGSGLVLHAPAKAAGVAVEQRPADGALAGRWFIVPIM